MDPLTEEQKRTLAAWVAQRLSLSEIQNRLEAEFNLSLTYLDVHLLMDSLQLVPHAPAPTTSAIIGSEPHAGKQPPAPPGAAPKGRAGRGAKPPPPGKEKTPPASLTVTVDNLTQPGAVVSGTVTFRNGRNASWMIDDLGRLGLVPDGADFKPGADDIRAFQVELQRTLSRLGML